MLDPLPSAPSPVFVRSPRLTGPRVFVRSTAFIDAGTAQAPPHLARAAVRRIAEYVAGRRCAEQALRDAGCAGKCHVGVAEDRAPIWPEGFVGSITHTSRFASAAVARTRDLRGVGIDSELVLEERVMLETTPLTLVASELRMLGRERARETATVVFSAKESLYKCLGPLVGTMFDFLDAEIQVSKEAIVRGAGVFRARLLSDLPNGFARGFALDGAFGIEGGHVHTALELPR